MDTENKSVNMGIGELGKGTTVFSRKFRWLLESQHLPSHFMKDVKFDFVNKTITFGYYDVLAGDEGMHALVWADKLQNRELFNEHLVFKALDGCGNELYRLVFLDLSLESHVADFDYSSSDAATTTLTIKYDIVHKILVACPDQFKRYEWRLFIDGKELPMYWDGEKRPTIKIEETEVDHLNTKMFIPGPARWQDMRIKLSEDIRHILGNRLFDGTKMEFELRLYQNGEIIETWGVQGVWVRSFTAKEKETALLLAIGSCTYQNHAKIN